MKVSQEIQEELSAYFFSREEILSAFLFGSTVKGDAGSDSDIDTAVYFFLQKTDWILKRKTYLMKKRKFGAIWKE